MSWRDILSPEETEIPKVPHQEHADKFYFDSQGVVHIEFVQEGKRVDAEFYNGVMDCLLKQIRQVRPPAFCCRGFFFLLHNNAPAHNAPSVCKFFAPKNVTTPYHPSYSTDLSPPEFSVANVENEVKRTPFCGYL
jgi:hypothetical protein